MTKRGTKIATEPKCKHAGIDLSGTGEWTKLVELQFRRPIKDIEAKIRMEASAAAAAGTITPSRSDLITKSFLKAAEATGTATDEPNAKGGLNMSPADGTDIACELELTALSQYVVQRTIVFLVSAASVGEPDAGAIADIRNARVCFLLFFCSLYKISVDCYCCCSALFFIVQALSSGLCMDPTIVVIVMLQWHTDYTCVCNT